MLSFSLVAEALTGLIYHRPSGENSKFALHSHLITGITDTLKKNAHDQSKQTIQ